MSDQGAPSTSPNDAPTFATFDKFVAGLPPSERVSVHKLYSLVKQGRVPVYRIPEVKAACVKVDEARAILASLTAQGRIRRGYGSFGPSAVVRDLTKVAGQTFRVDQ